MDAADEVKTLGVYVTRFTSVAASLGSSSNVTSSGTNLFEQMRTSLHDHSGRATALATVLER